MLVDDCRKMKLLLACALAAFLSLIGSAHPGGHYAKDPFRQIDEVLPDPNEIRAANGAPGPEYWQQRADYKIQVVLDDEKQRISGSEVITYTNNSPHALTYLWVQLDQNRFEQQALGHQAMEAPDFEDIGFRTLRSELSREEFEGGYQIQSVHDENQKPLNYSIIDTMMRVEVSVKPGATTVFGIEWEHNIVNAKAIRARGVCGFER